MAKPFFSIITVSFRAEDTIAATIESVLSQNFDDFEIIVKDGLSDDDTLKNIPEDSRIKVFSQKDTGIYDAMNQAISLASGEYLHFLNCGDCFADELVLEKVYGHILSVSGAKPSIVYGDYSRKNTYCKQPSRITDFYLYRTPLNHQSMFFSESVFRDIGRYDSSMRIYADYELTLRTFKANGIFSHIQLVICEYMGDGVSENPKLRDIKKDEYRLCVNKHFSNKERRKYNFYLALSLKGLRQKLASDDAPKWIKNTYRWLVNRVNK